MLRDLLRRLTTPCPAWARDMGYLREQHGIQGRHARCRGAWEPHLRNTRRTILAAVERCPARRKAVVFGSGPLLDVPLPELAAAFREVVLVDIVHPLGGDWRLANVTALTADVTGVVEALHEAPHAPDRPLPLSRPTLFLDDPEVDLAASVNLLSQLPSIPCQYLADCGQHRPGAIQAMARDLVRAHLDYLTRLPGVATLVCDLERRTLDRHGRLVERKSALRGVPFPWAGEEWIWDLAPRPETDPNLSYQRRVIGVVDIKHAPPRGPAKIMPGPLQ